jgi:ubiquinol-cytochrome c reductase cytochrome b/c1 subunit
MQTPPHIVPEWYFLPFYAMLRAVPDILFVPAKLAGVIAMFGSIFLLFLLPWLYTSRVRSARFRPIYKWVFWLLLFDCLVLGWGFVPPACNQRGQREQGRSIRLKRKLVGPAKPMR